MKRKLCQCPVCKEWFNTTSAVMSQHYRTKHEFALNKAFAIAELVMTMAMHDAKSKITPFPESMQHYVAARMTEHQISLVQSAASPDSRIANVAPMLVPV
jgi:hypothetical protein